MYGAIASRHRIATHGGTVITGDVCRNEQTEMSVLAIHRSQSEMT